MIQRMTIKGIGSNIVGYLEMGPCALPQTTRKGPDRLLCFSQRTGDEREALSVHCL